MIETNIILRSVIGVVVLIGAAVALSKDRGQISKRIVASGLVFLVVIAFLMIKVPLVKGMVEGVSTFFIKLVDFSDAGSTFVFGGLVDQLDKFGFIYAFHVLPNIIFFSAISSILYYFGLLGLVVKFFAWILTKAYKLSGAECAAAAANVFLGQVTAPMMIKPFLPKMSKQEIFSVMTSGMATMAGSVILGVIGLLSVANPGMKQEFARYLLTASLLNAPAALLIAHIIMPKSGVVDSNIKICREDMGLNAFDAIAEGTNEGVRVALSVGAIVIVFTAMVSLVNWILLDGVGEFLGINDWIANITGGLYDGFSLQAILGTVFAPFAWLIGVGTQDLMIAGQLLGEKVVLNEFFAYVAMAKNMESGVLTDPRTIMLLTFGLCNFANLTSIGVQISGFTAMSPNQRGNVSKYALLAVVAGNIASLLSTCIAGAILS